MSGAPLDEALDALGLCVFEGAPDGSFRLTSAAPAWLRASHGGELEAGRAIDLIAAHPLLEDFLPGAERVWSGEGERRLSTGIWTERDVAGSELHLEAIALRTSPGRRVLCITRHEETFDELQELHQRARDALASFERLRDEVAKKELLLHCIVHDLKGPLSGVLGHLSLLEARELAAPRAREIAGKALVQARRQLDMIRQVSELFAAELHELESFETRAPFAPDLAEVLRAAVETSRPAFEQRGVQLVATCEPCVPLHVAGNRERLERVVVNLLENALRHAPVESEVRVQCADEGESALVRVEDRGPGVPEEERTRLFQKYARGARGGLAGLGLFSARLAIERWGGAIGYEPRAGGGASFWFRLPKASAESA